VTLHPLSILSIAFLSYVLLGQAIKLVRRIKDWRRPTL